MLVGSSTSGSEGIRFPATRAVLWDRTLDEERTQIMVCLEDVLGHYIVYITGDLLQRLQNRDSGTQFALARFIHRTTEEPQISIEAGQGKELPVDAVEVRVDVQSVSDERSYTSGVSSNWEACVCVSAVCGRQWTVAAGESEAAVHVELESHFPHVLLKPLKYPLRILPTPLSARLMSAEREFIGDSIGEYGFITLDAGRKCVCLLVGDELSRTMPLVGVWCVVGGAQHRDRIIFTAVEHYRRSDLISDRVLAGGEALLVLIITKEGTCDFYEGTVEHSSELTRRTVAEAAIDLSDGSAASDIIKMTNAFSMRESPGEPNPTEEAAVVQESTPDDEEDLVPRKPRSPHQSTPEQVDALVEEPPQTDSAVPVGEVGSEGSYKEAVCELQRVMMEMQTRLDQQESYMEALSRTVKELQEELERQKDSERALREEVESMQQLYSEDRERPNGKGMATSHSPSSSSSRSDPTDHKCAKGADGDVLERLNQETTPSANSHALVPVSKISRWTDIEVPRIINVYSPALSLTPSLSGCSTPLRQSTETIDTEV
ncbi:hypothetical protein FOZ61_002220 [Perkinsus olseni]|uniref:STIL N-terminal domain-containing protein n=1 Tax=Perkinsus olseni TaxID=32597 RepID=A0A7J6MUB8_PEROL|nr:hypothetical protein FOZ61_002220 [Perkinsus olseni]KAF4675189.1 hypothetical protein FOL46_002455 [Perkinsus olseni]